jgi:type VI secretion system protein ImpH
MTSERPRYQEVVEFSDPASAPANPAAVRAASASTPGRLESQPPVSETPARTRTVKGVAAPVGALSFYQALRRIESAYPERPRIGEASTPSEEPLRLGQDPSLAAHSTSLAAMTWVDDAGLVRIRVNFFGAFGANGPLPLHLTEFARQRLTNQRDSTLVAFVDIFHQRLLSLFYRAWANAQPTVSLDRPDADRFARYLSALSAQAEAQPQRRRLDAFALHMAGHFACVARHPEGLRKLLGEYLQVPVAIEQFVGEWLSIPEPYRWKLGGQPVQGVTLGKLGESSRIGGEVWEHQTKFRIALGPLSREDYDSLLPGSPRLSELRELVQRYVGKDMAWDIQLVLRRADMQATVLGIGGTLGRTSHIGPQDELSRKTWQDLVFDPSHIREGDRDRHPT